MGTSVLLLPDLAEEIACAHAAVLSAGAEVVERAAEVGRLLLRVKDTLPHGAFLPWVQESCPFSERTARRYLRIYQHLPELREQIGHGMADLGLVSALKLLRNPAKDEPRPEVDQRTCTLADLTALAGHKFGTIYADPPWPYGNQATRAATDNHYATMSVEEIAALPVAALGADTGHLHLWTTNAFLRPAFDIIEAWGYEYKSAFVWTKEQMGIGNYWRVSHEFLLLGVRGSCTFEDKGLKSWAVLPRGRHSQKPHAVRKMIERASPGPRLELFGRRPEQGWTVWGNEIDRRDMFDALIPVV